MSKSYTKLCEKTRNRFSSLISGEKSPPSKHSSYLEPSSFEKKLNIIYQQNSKILKNMNKLLSGQRKLEERLRKLEEENETEDKDFVNVIISFLTYYTLL